MRTADNRPLPMHVRLRRARLRLGLSVAQVALASGYSEATIYKIEEGRRAPSDHYILVIVAASKRRGFLYSGLGQELLAARRSECGICRGKDEPITTAPTGGHAA